MRENLRTPNFYRVWGHGGFVHICFESPGCRFRKQGYCIMCDYGAGRMLQTDQAVSSLRSAISQWNEPISRLLLGTCGSIFDDDEMLPETLYSLLKEIAKAEIHSVVFETHYSTVTPEKLEKIKSLLPEKQLAVELGLESSDPDILKNSLNKYMDLEELTAAVKIIKSYGFSTILNVFLGVPNLSPQQQLNDTVNSLRWAYSNGADEVVIFPANIKPDTELWNQYKRGKYKAVSSWLLVELLQRLTEDELTKTSISWYGDRQYAGVDTDIIPPISCYKCRDVLMRFYSEFMSSFDAERRKTLLDEVKRFNSCDCRLRFLESIY